MADASIYSMIKPAAPAPDPIAQYGQVMNLKTLMGQQGLQDLQRKTLEKGIADEAATEDAYRQSGGDRTKLRELLTGAGRYKQIEALNKLEREQKKDDATIAKDTAAAGANTWKVQLEKLQHGAALLDAAKDPASFDMVLTVGERANVFAPEVVAQLRQQGYSPQLVQSLQAAGLTRAQQLAEQGAAATRAETGRHNVATETNAAGQLKVSQGQLGVAQGNLGVSRERLAMDRDAPKGTYDAERGIIVEPRGATSRPVTDASGAPIGPKDNNKDVPEAQLMAGGYATRMQKAEAILEKFKENGMPGVIESTYGKSPLGGKVISNVSRSPERQQYHQAAEDWVRAKLRKESGAVIGDEEMDREIRTYFPQIGDGPEVIKQKRDSRKTAEQAMVMASGRALKSGAAGPPSASDPLGLFNR